MPPSIEVLYFGFASKENLTAKPLFRSRYPLAEIGNIVRQPIGICPWILCPWNPVVHIISRQNSDRFDMWRMEYIAPEPVPRH